MCGNNSNCGCRSNKAGGQGTVKTVIDEVSLGGAQRIKVLWVVARPG